MSMFIDRGKRLEESLEYQQFVANVEEEEAWINEKLNLVGSEDYGDTLAAVQVHLCHRLNAYWETHDYNIKSVSKHIINDDE